MKYLNTHVTIGEEKKSNILAVLSVSNKTGIYSSRINKHWFKIILFTQSVNNNS